MRDQHRPKQHLVNDVAALRKQIADLKESMSERRRVEDALRQSEQQFRVLTDSAPVGLCLLRPDGAPLLVNRPFAQALGYESPAELLRVAAEVGLFARREEGARMLALAGRNPEGVSEVTFRRKDGTHQSLGVLAARRGDAASVVLVDLSPAGAGDTRPV